MKTIIVSITLSASLILPFATRVAVAEPSTKTAASFVHPKFRQSQTTAAPAAPQGKVCLRPRFTSLKGALGGYAAGQKLMHCKAAMECGAPQCPGHVTCVGASK
jgi:hypothetical protein